MVFQYKKVLLIGATSGIGAAMADRLVEAGVHVIAVGRRQERLDAFVQKHGAQKTSAVQFDITDASNLPSFVSKILRDFPDLDSVFLNAGTQSPYRLSQPEHVDLGRFHDEVHTNFTSIVNLAMAFLPHLQAKDVPTSLIFTGTNICVVPAVTVPAYSASKAALNAFVYCLRAQSESAHKRTKIIEIWPPVVKSSYSPKFALKKCEIHDYMGIERGRSMGMPADAFADEVFGRMEAGEEEIIVGTVGSPDMTGLFRELVADRKTIFDGLSRMMLAHFEL
ncbi:NAD(P)-binding domain protein [Niveomyces insectorum RCEF 264]|uniref:NAD(P)-binding domain protein n=1 Tax=Niveomyces insectorum RCEF 264 TaxID=1081102 RepID=A0A167S0V5_9HYPO|nr:NAD(P)-binding domain protein [Niveomyces insectorum RCEF 264]